MANDRTRSLRKTVAGFWVTRAQRVSAAWPRPVLALISFWPGREAGGVGGQLPGPREGLHHPQLRAVQRPPGHRLPFGPTPPQRGPDAGEVELTFSRLSGTCRTVFSPPPPPPPLFGRHSTVFAPIPAPGAQVRAGGAGEPQGAVQGAPLVGPRHPLQGARVPRGGPPQQPPTVHGRMKPVLPCHPCLPHLPCLPCMFCLPGLPCLLGLLGLPHALAACTSSLAVDLPASASCRALIACSLHLAPRTPSPPSRFALAPLCPDDLPTSPGPSAPQPRRAIWRPAGRRRRGGGATAAGAHGQSL